MHKHIFLISMPGAGKTTVGKMLAKELGRDFYDLDQTIQDKVGNLYKIFIFMMVKMLSPSMNTVQLKN